MKVALVASLLSAVLLIAGCGGGGGGDKTFEGDGYSFNYPAHWDEGEVEAFPGATAFAPEEGLSGLIFEVGESEISVTESNIDSTAGDLAEEIQESTEGPTRLTVAGLPALEIVAHPQSGETRRITTVFDGRTMYIFDCGFTPPRAAEIKRGCDQALESFQVD